MNWHTRQIVETWQRLENLKLNKHVFFDRVALEIVVKKHAQDTFNIPNWREEVYPKHSWAFASFQLWANCFNAHYNVFAKPDTKYTVENPNPTAKPFTGAFAMDRTIYEHFGERIIQAHDFAKHTRSPRAMAKFFGGTVPMPSPELKQMCGECFLVNLENQYQGNPLNLLEEAMVWDEDSKHSVLRAFNDGKGLVELLTDNFGIAYYDAQNLKIDDLDYFLNFNKRAQLVAVILHGRALDSNGILPVVEDIDEIGPIADYELPKALRALGILSYSKELAELVDNWREVWMDSQMEIEIRAATVAACVKLLEEINKIRTFQGKDAIDLTKPINICHLDYWLWKMGKEIKTSRPHLTRTSAY